MTRFSACAASILFCLLVPDRSPSSNPQVTLRVIVPATTPDTAAVYVAGNQPVLGSWNPGSVRCSRESDSVWVYSFRVPRATAVELKITLGSWSSEAMYVKDRVPDNLRLVVESDTTVTLRPVAWKNVFYRMEGGITGTVHYHRGLAGNGLQYQHDCIVWLPPSYDSQPMKSYPVLYMHDGQNVFDPSTSFMGVDWGVDETADSLIGAGAMHEIIVVGITNSPDRAPEYSDTPLGRAYARFVIETVKPLIDSTYRTKPGREHTAVMGSSMGGLISFLFVWWHPDVFSTAGCLSSAFLVDDGKVLQEVRDSDGFPESVKIYVDCGTEELDGRLKPGFDRMVSLLKQKGMKEGKDLSSYLDQGARHNEQAWAARVWRPLTFMFGTD